MIMSESRMNLKDTHNSSYEFGSELRKGPWTTEEDNLLIRYISCNGEGLWNSSAKNAGLKRTGKSCRLRWLNYLKPGIKRGNLSPHEQLLIFELHAKWGNKWSRIAQHLPGRTDNEIKNYWRTKVQKQARHLKVDSNSKKFLEAVGKFWKPRLLEKVERDSSIASSSTSSISTMETQKFEALPPVSDQALLSLSCPKSSNLMNYSDSNSSGKMICQQPNFAGQLNTDKIQHENSSLEDNYYYVGIPEYDVQEFESDDISLSGLHLAETDWFGEDLRNTFRYSDELWQFRTSGEVGV